MGRAVLVIGDECVDVHEVSGGRFAADPHDLFGQWADFKRWAEQMPTGSPGQSYSPDELWAPSPSPRQVFGIGMNYRAHAEEVGAGIPEVPLVFSKFPSCIAGPAGVVSLSGLTVDWEVEVVVVIGEGGHRIPAADAWSRVAGITGGQDISDRTVQKLPSDNPQHGLGKSFPGYGPTGPLLVTPEEFADCDNIALGCWLNGQEVQNSTTSDLIFSVPVLIEYLSRVVRLLPGDLIFTGTPSGIGRTRTPSRFLGPADVLTSTVQEVGEIRLTFAEGPV